MLVLNHQRPVAMFNMLLSCGVIATVMIGSRLSEAQPVGAGGYVESNVEHHPRGGVVDLDVAAQEQQQQQHQQQYYDEAADEASRADAEESSEPVPYSFEYTASDPGGSHSHTSSSDGRTVAGEYTIQLADGRMRTVKYIADENGYRAEIITNELGTESRNPADVTIESSAPTGAEAALEGPGAPAPAPAAAGDASLAADEAGRSEVSSTSSQAAFADQYPYHDAYAQSQSASYEGYEQQQQQQQQHDQYRRQDNSARIR